jgi:hypothetical protein
MSTTDDAIAAIQPHGVNSCHPKHEVVIDRVDCTSPIGRYWLATPSLSRHSPVTIMRQIFPETGRELSARPSCNACRRSSATEE